MFTGFSTALSALNATATAVDVVGNNLANLNTTVFKTSVVSFHDLVTQSLGAGLGETQVGFGTARPLTVRQFTQGAVQASTGMLDAAVQGDGFFIVKDSNGAQLFTRAGNFQVDKDGYLLTSTKEHVQGWQEAADGTLNANGPISDIQIPVGSLRQPIATTQFSMNMNLDSTGTVGQIDGAFSHPMEVVDSLGNSHVLTVNFTKTGMNTWDYNITIPAADVDPAVTNPLVTGTITFNTDGTLLSPDPTAPSVTVPSIALSDGAAPLNINWNLYDPTGKPLLTQYAQTSTVSAESQDGVPPAQLTRVGLSDGGQILAQYSNGTQQVVGQLAMASIRNPESLIAVGNNNFQASAASALPAIGLPDTGGRGTILGGALEASTVDIAQEFTNLIVLQRGYQANAKVVTAVDELSQDTINLKR